MKVGQYMVVMQHLLVETDVKDDGKVSALKSVNKLIRIMKSKTLAYVSIRVM